MSHYVILILIIYFVYFDIFYTLIRLLLKKVCYYTFFNTIKIRMLYTISSIISNNKIVQMLFVFFF